MVNILVPLAALLIAVLVVAALWLWWTGEQPEAVTADVADRNIAAFTSVEITPTMTATVAPTAPASNVGAPQSGIEILRVARDRNGELNVTLSGVTYHNMSDFEANPLMRDDFLSTLRALAQFTQSTENVSVPAPTAASVVSAPARTEAPKSAPARNAAAKTAEEEAAALEAERNSMAGQIETLLQARLLKTAGMEDRSIHIHSAPSGGVEIDVDGLQYDSVSDIADTAARSVIEAAIRDWEAANPI